MPVQLIKGFIILIFIFVPLEIIFFLKKQKIFRSGWFTDVIYFFVGYILGRSGIAISFGISLGILSKFNNIELQNFIVSQSLFLQFLELVIIADTGYYIAHRLLHTIPWLWKFHAVHHSSEYMDWLATVRVHPLDQVFTKTFQMIPVYLLGFNEASLAAYAIFSATIAFLIHANIKVRFGILKWIFATPEFHHWHHTKEPQIHNKNFAAQIPILDLIFGTLYMPKNQMPKSYGIFENVPNEYIEQILSPFRKKTKYGK